MPPFSRGHFESDVLLKKRWADSRFSEHREKTGPGKWESKNFNSSPKFQVQAGINILMVLLDTHGSCLFMYSLPWIFSIGPLRGVFFDIASKKIE